MAEILEKNISDLEMFHLVGMVEMAKNEDTFNDQFGSMRLR